MFAKSMAKVQEAEAAKNPVNAIMIKQEDETSVHLSSKEASEKD